jgi:hypothetical protein
LTVFNATPSGLVSFVRGTTPGTGSLTFRNVGTVTLDMADPQVVAQAIADAGGRAVAILTVSAASVGQTLYFQALEQAPNLQITNLLSRTVLPPDQTPVAADDSAATLPSTAVEVRVLANDLDADGDPLTVTGTTAPAHGTATINSTNTIAIEYLPADNFTGEDSFTYTVSDGRGGTATATVHVTVLGNASRFVADDSVTRASGESAGTHSLTPANIDPRGVATTTRGETVWVVDASRTVFVYSQTGALLGSWTDTSLKTPTGIATDGTHLWIVDKGRDRVYYYANGVSRRSGVVTATSAFALTSGNTNPEGLATDGSTLWVVNSSLPDQVFVYSTAGELRGSWSLDAANSSPAGLTIDPTGASQDIWVVDGLQDQVYGYANARLRTSGSLAAAFSFALASDRRSPQDIADPNAPLIVSSATISPLHHRLRPTDVNNDGKTTPQDVLLAINYLNRRLPTEVSKDADAYGEEVLFYDVSNDFLITALDVLQVINVLNQPTVAAGEGEGDEPALPSLTLDTARVARAAEVIPQPSRTSIEPSGPAERARDAVFQRFGTPPEENGTGRGFVLDDGSTATDPDDELLELLSRDAERPTIALPHRGFTLSSLPIFV